MEVLFALGVRIGCSRLCGRRGIFSAPAWWIGLREKIIRLQVQYEQNPRWGKSHVYLDIQFYHLHYSQGFWGRAIVESTIFCSIFPHSWCCLIFDMGQCEMDRGNVCSFIHQKYLGKSWRVTIKCAANHSVLCFLTAAGHLPLFDLFFFAILCHL